MVMYPSAQFFSVSSKHLDELYELKVVKVDTKLSYVFIFHSKIDKFVHWDSVLKQCFSILVHNFTPKESLRIQKKSI